MDRARLELANKQRLGLGAALGDCNPALGRVPDLNSW